MTTINERSQSVDIDQMLQIVGEYGWFQKIVNIIFCIMMFPAAFPCLIAYFSVQSPAWKCNLNSTICNNKSATYNSNDTTRCSPQMKRSDWDYVTSSSYSIVTEFDLVCNREYLIQLQTSVLFFGFIFRALIIGWCADNFGRKRVLFISLTAIIMVGFVSVFVGNIFVFIACRFVIGFFLHGTYPQLYIMISEIVGNKDRAFANNITFFSLGFAFCTLALKAYLLPNWRTLHIVCTAPYVFVLIFMKFVPESVRYLRVKGELDAAMAVFRRIAYWNKTIIPDNVTISPASTINHKASPLDLFRTRKMARVSCILGWSTFTVAMSFYCLYYTAGNISGHMYIDFVLITVLDIPASLILTPLVNKYGRKRCSMALLLLAAASCMGLGFAPNHGQFKILRIILGMFGKTCNVLSGMAATTWRMELYPTTIRGEAGGLTQLTNKIGATCSPWLDAWLSTIYPGAVFIVIGVLMFVTALLQSLLWETKGTNVGDTSDDDGGSAKTMDLSAPIEIRESHLNDTFSDVSATNHTGYNLKDDTSCC